MQKHMPGLVYFFYVCVKVHRNSAGWSCDCSLPHLWYSEVLLGVAATSLVTTWPLLSLFWIIIDKGKFPSVLFNASQFIFLFIRDTVCGQCRKKRLEYSEGQKYLAILPFRSYQCSHSIVSFLFLKIHRYVTFQKTGILI